MDRLTAERRSWNMSRVRGKNTLPELKVRSLLHRLRFRFSLKSRDLPGRPDIVLPRYGAVVFVHGCFWHQHKRCGKSALPKTRTEFWLAKLEENVERDRRNAVELKDLGWKVLTVWECELTDEARISARLRTDLLEPHDKSVI
jgi:DNA mismatch endonuclease, patch repair protein